MSAFARMMKPVADRVRLMVGRAIISAVNDGAKIQMLQAELLADEVQDKVERFQQYGHTSVPLADCEAIIVFVGGLRSHGVCIATDDRRYRPTGLEPGESMLYDDQGQKIYFSRDGLVIETSKPLTIRAESVLLESESIDLGAAGGQPVARVGDPVVGGVIAVGSDVVRAA